MPAESATRSFDVVLYGATGFTGRQAAATFAERVDDRLSWAVAGRDEVRLRAVRDELGPGGAGAGVVVADALDAEAVDRMVADARVVLSTAGPYAKYGANVVASCARHGTHYVDITGETPWIRAMIDAHHEAARASGTRIVPGCGYDSVPSDLSAWFLARQLQERGTGAAQLECVFLGKGGVNGGTVASLMNQLEDRAQLRRLLDPRLLNPPAHRAVRRGEVDPTRARWHEGLKRWVAPFFMGPVNTRVVRRSVALAHDAGEAYGTDPVYQEWMRAGSRAQALAFAGGLWAMPRVLASRRVRRLVGRFLPDPGEGPSEQAMDEGFVSVALFGRGEDGTELRGRFSSPGDPGNRVTVALVTECALALAEDLHELPDRGGVITPAFAFGEVLARRVRARGMTLELSR